MIDQELEMDDPQQKMDVSTAWKSLLHGLAKGWNCITIAAICLAVPGTLIVGASLLWEQYDLLETPGFFRIWFLSILVCAIETSAHLIEHAAKRSSQSVLAGVLEVFLETGYLLFCGCWGLAYWAGVIKNSPKSHEQLDAMPLRDVDSAVMVEWMQTDLGQSGLGISGVVSLVAFVVILGRYCWFKSKHHRGKMIRGG